MPGRMVTTYEQPALREALEDVLRPGGLALTDEVLAASGLQPGALLADVGCGAGITVGHLAERHALRAVGFDASPLLLAAGRQRAPGLPLVRGIAGRLPVAGAALDAVLAECSLSALPDRAAALAEFHRVLKPGGRLLLTDLYLRDACGGPSLRPCAGPLTREQLAAALAEQGFELVTWCDQSHTLKVLAARLILAGTSVAWLLAEGCAAGVDRRWLGYYWLIATRS